MKRYMHTSVVKPTLKLLTLAVSTLMFTAIQADTGLDSSGYKTGIRGVGDLEIYQSAAGSAPRLMMMLDTSGSMGISSLVLPKNNSFGSPGDVDKSLCDHIEIDKAKQWQYNKVDKRGPTISVIGDSSRTVTNKSNGKKTFYHVASVGGRDIEFYTRGCEANGVSMEDRLSRLKAALIGLLASKDLNSNVVMGLGHYSARANPNQTNTTLKVTGTDINLVDGHSGTILVAAAKLDNAQRIKLAEAIAKFQSVDTTTNEKGESVTTDAVSFNSYLGNYYVSRLSPVTAKPLNIYRAAGGTPTAHAYAEAAAYMMGTTTGGVPNDMKIKWLYDSTSILYNPADKAITYWVCVQTDPNRTTLAFGGRVPIRQCYNQDGDVKLKASFISCDNNSRCYINDNYTQLWKPNGKNGWAKVKTGPKSEAYDQLAVPYMPGKNTEQHIWEIMKKIPVGWRLGGSVKVAHEAMDIEPVSGGIWDAKDEVGYSRGSDPIRSLVTYRTNPFTYEGDTGQKVCPAENGISYEHFTSDNNPFKCRSTIDMETTQDNCNKGYYSNCYFIKVPVYPQYWWQWKRFKDVLKGRHRKHPTAVTSEVDNNFGGMRYSDVNSMNSAKSQYNKVASDASCSGNGIYFLTDGAPNSTKDSMAQTIMNRTLSDAKYQFTAKPTGQGVLESPALPSGMFSGETGGWEYIGEYAKKLVDPTKNPAGVSIKTAVVGFGSSFESAKDGNCDAVTNQDAKNACKWGQKGGGYGEGGFYYVESSDDIKNSILTFITSLDNTIPAAPSGTITIPKDPYRAIGELPYALMPSLQSQLDSDNQLRNIWPGNVKKYNLNDGTLVGKSNKPIFVNVAGDLNADTQDLWQKQDFTKADASGVRKVANDAVEAGGAYEHLKTPNNGQGSRTIWVEDLTARGATTTVLRKLEVGANGKPVGFEALVDTTANTGAYSRENQIKLLKFLGYKSAIVNGQEYLLDSLPATAVIKDIVLKTPSSPIKVMGASIHSKPVVVSYGATLDNGRVQNSGRDDYALFGSMDGVLHLVDADGLGKNNGGEESLGIIPRIMMRTQIDALVPDSQYIENTQDSTRSIRRAKTPYFGIDGHWTVKNEYEYKYGDNKVISKSTFAYGGMRLGGKGLLGYDLTNKNNPKVAFTKLNKSLIDDKTAGFERIGYIFNQPSIGKMKVGTETKDVLIFGGGYDMCYENESFQIGVASTTANGIDTTCAAKTQADGNAVYIIDAKTGEKLWSATYNATGTFDGTKYMKHSIVGGITALDRNNDGTIDQLYFADLGGQVFRADFKDGTIKQGDSNSGRVTRLLKDNQEGTSFARRFFERPNVSFYRNGSLFAMINIISGDRSSPLSKIRTTSDNADRIYGIIDNDVTKFDSQFYGQNFQLKIKDLVVGDMKVVNLGAGATQRNTAKTQMQQGTVNAWYYPLTKFDGWSNVNYSKGVGRSEVVANQLFTMVYNPDMNYSSADSCTAKIVGGSERQMYCLPWGICHKEDGQPTENGTGGYERAGQGIQELNFGPRNASQPNQRLLISTQSINNVLKIDNRTDFGTDIKKKQGVTGEPSLQGQTGLTTTDGSGSMERNIYIERYILTPKRWFEQD